MEGGYGQIQKCLTKIGMCGTIIKNKEVVNEKESIVDGVVDGDR